jgi:hypothetical protein
MLVGKATDLRHLIGPNIVLHLQAARGIGAIR